ncbi:MAG: hypothetical protein E7566_03910 [Ruminococcaceae bacterium]|nr:hypothetical protein [Oscillospiraceae bacterium]
MFVLVCPNCAANLEIDERGQIAFCQYCGTKIANINNTIQINREREIDNLILRAIEFECRGDYEKAKEYCMRVLDLEPDNIKARELERRLPGYSAGPNVTIVYRSVHDDRFKLRITLDGKTWKILSKNEAIKLELPLGKHRILFLGKKSYTYELVIADTSRKITVVYMADSRRNTIEQFDD